LQEQKNVNNFFVMCFHDTSTCSVSFLFWQALCQNTYEYVSQILIRSDKEWNWWHVSLSLSLSL